MLLQMSSGSNVLSIGKRIVTSAASGSTKKLNSAVGDWFPGTVIAPPMMMVWVVVCMVLGDFLIASAILVRGPRAMILTSRWVLRMLMI